MWNHNFAGGCKSLRQCFGPKNRLHLKAQFGAGIQFLGTTVAPLIAASFLLGTDVGNVIRQVPFLVIAMSFFLLAVLFSIITIGNSW